MAQESQGINAREFLKKVFERLAPPIAYLVNPQVGIAISVAVFATWLLSRIGKSGRVRDNLDDEKLVLVELSAKIDEKRRRIEVLENELARVSDETTRRMIEHAIKMERTALQSLMEEYELRQLRVAALSRLRDLGDEELYRKVLELLRDVESGKRFEDKQLEVLKMLEERWRRRQLETSILLQIVEHG